MYLECCCDISADKWDVLMRGSKPINYDWLKNKEHYKQFAEYGESQVNLYFVDGEWRKYVNGKRIE